MDFINHTLLSLTKWLRPYMDETAMAIIATLLVLYGDDINTHITKHIKSHHFFVRLTIYVALCAFGYGAVMVFLTDVLEIAFREMDPRLPGPIIASVFIVIGILAERKGHI